MPICTFVCVKILILKQSPVRELSGSKSIYLKNFVLHTGKLLSRKMDEMWYITSSCASLASACCDYWVPHSTFWSVFICLFLCCIDAIIIILYFFFTINFLTYICPSVFLSNWQRFYKKNWYLEKYWFEGDSNKKIGKTKWMLRLGIQENFL